MDNIKQEHYNYSDGDNVGRDKNIYYFNNENKSLNSKIAELKHYETLDFADNSTFKALKTIIVTFIKGEQKKPHDMVPTVKIRDFCKQYSENELVFEKIIAVLIDEKKLTKRNVQVCHTFEDLDYRI